MKEVLDKSSEILKNMCATDERRIVQRLLEEIGKQGGLATYGLDPVLNTLKIGEVETALVTDTTDLIEITVICKKCELSKAQKVNVKNKPQTVQEMISIPCERCGADEYAVEEKDIVDVLEDLASQTNEKVEVISTESDEKAKLTALGGFAALLRYRQK